ncbi:phosphoglucomutase/phosphomannomutase, alpha/beta/alpha domain I family protein [Mycobacterium xenopi 3993]|nr:phosphoglucomutase/phosphomannomutase, alpha/beta/alpha domain I family protein [Mycobacterium xenopi 3993]
MTPSHNPPADGGFKYNPPSGGPADSDATNTIAKRANEILRGGLADVKRVTLTRALRTAWRHDYLDAYVDDLPNVVDIRAIRDAGCGSVPTRWAGQCGLLGCDRRAAQSGSDRG